MRARNRRCGIRLLQLRITVDDSVLQKYKMDAEQNFVMYSETVISSYMTIHQVYMTIHQVYMTIHQVKVTIHQVCVTIHQVYVTIHVHIYMYTYT